MLTDGTARRTIVRVTTPLVNRAFPGGTTTIAAYQSWLVNDVVQSPQMPDGMVHPLFAYLAAHAGMGMTWTELLTLCDSSPEDGPMQGEVELEFFAALTVGHSYAVRGSITDVVHKVGRRTGAFDVVTYRLELLETDTLVARATCSIVFPRRP